jgi:RNA polymerase sigma-54 factor
MALNLQLNQKMSQSLVMTPRLQQAIKLLQLNHFEMVAHVEEALLENPTLEAVPDSSGADGLELESRRLKDQATEVQDQHDQNNGDVSDNLDWDKFVREMADSPRGASMAGGTIYDDLPPIETNLTYGDSLAEHMMWQGQMLKMSAEEERAARVIVHNLDHRGWLTVGIDEVVEEADVDAEAAQDALEIVQGLDPVGCGARSLSECLVLQARHHYPEDPNFEVICTEHLHDLERRNYTAIGKALEIELEDVHEYHRMIQDLEPYPGRGFSTDEPRYITPDVTVIKHDGEWHVLVNDEGLPELRVGNFYKKVMKKASKEDRDYLLDKLRGAEFLIKSIHKRRRTIRRVMESIVRFQNEFFDRGPQALRPLVLQDVADDVGVHMSTVSRVTTNKYVHTPHGILELKFFFSSSVKQGGGGADVAAEAIKTQIKALVASENSKKPLSDQKLANLLLEQAGVKVARRTVAKYREAMGILPSSQRKQMF